MAKKTISNTFTVNTVIDGEDAVVATCSPDKISIQCNADGSVVSTKGYSVSFGLKVGSIDISQYITDVTRGSLPTGVSISSTPVAYAKTIVVSNTATATGMASGITFTVSASYSGKTYSANVTVALIGAVQGDVGERGKVGRFFYYARDWDASNNSETFLINDATTPFFSNAGSDSKHYYVFNKFFDDSQDHYLTMKDMADASEKVGGQIAWNKAPWQVMTDDIKYLISEAIFTDFAKLGSFIVSGDWLISTNGTINGTAYVNGASYYGAPAYTWFDPAYPNTDHTKKVTIGGGQQVTVHNFIPNLAFDGRTGTTYQQNAHIKGEIRATGGTIGGFVISPTQISSNNNNIVLNSNGTATITGTINATGGNITGNLSVTGNGKFTVGSTSSRHIVVNPSDSYGASIVGEDGTAQMFSLGFSLIMGSYKPRLLMGDKDAYNKIVITNDSYFQYLGDETWSGIVRTENIGISSKPIIGTVFSNGQGNKLEVGIKNNGFTHIVSDNWARNYNSVDVGGVYVDGDGFLHVRIS